MTRRNAVVWGLWFSSLMILTSLTCYLMLLRGPLLSVIIIALVCGIGVVGGVLYSPRIGLYLIIALTCSGDPSLVPWNPFLRNFSSYGSPLYIHDSLVFSPLEAMLVLTYFSWLGRCLMERKIEWYGGPLLLPILVFLGFIIFGLIYGIIRGGNLTIALWECRWMFYLPMVFILTSNFITTRIHVSGIMWAAMIAWFLEGVGGVWKVVVELNFDTSQAESIASHSFSIHAASFITMAIVIWMYRTSLTHRVALPLMLPWVLMAFVYNQRRASYIALIFALILIVAVLYFEHRTIFWLIAPAAILFSLAYVAVFWNSNSSLAMPVRAIKSAIAPDTVSARDQASNEYREIENINSMFTIKTAPLTGVGFGNKFIIVAPMADISKAFVFWEYITHNSIFWIWMKTGVGGFMSMFFLIGYSLLYGVRTLWRMPGDEMSAIALVAVLYIFMHFLFAYVDMSWDGQNMVYLGLLLGLLNILERAAVTCPTERKRWPWQPDPPPPPSLRPL